VLPAPPTLLVREPVPVVASVVPEVVCCSPEDEPLLQPAAAREATRNGRHAQLD
jgi:hypothetical protein